MAQKEGINTPLVVTLAAVSCAFILVTVFAVEAVFNYEVREERETMWSELELPNKNPVSIARARQTQSIKAESAAEHKMAIDKAMQAIAESGGKVQWKTN